MTTIVYDPKERALYADTRISMGGTLVNDNYVKLHLIEYKSVPAILALSGHVADIQLFVEHLTNNEFSLSQDWRPRPGYTFSGMLLTADQLYNIDSMYLTPYIIDERDNWTAGSGGKVAAVALECGKTGEEALAIAKKMDLASGGDTYAAKFVDEHPIIVDKKGNVYQSWETSNAV